MSWLAKTSLLGNQMTGVTFVFLFAFFDPSSPRVTMTAGLSSWIQTQNGDAWISLSVAFSSGDQVTPIFAASCGSTAWVE